MVIVFSHGAPHPSSSYPFIEYDASVCAGAPWTVAFSQGVNVTFLYLFGSFYSRSYGAKGGDTQGSKKKTKAGDKKQQAAKTD